MSDKMTCPVCDSYSSSVLHAVVNGQPCPSCGTPARVILQVNELRKTRADEELKAELERVTIELSKVAAERDRLRRIVQKVRLVLGGDA